MPTHLIKNLDKAFMSAVTTDEVKLIQYTFN